MNSDSGGQAVVAGDLIAAASLASGAQPFGSLIARLLKGGTNVDVIVRALEERGLARRLAEPNLVTMSGVSASFLAGGEFPFPIEDNRADPRRWSVVCRTSPLRGIRPRHGSRLC